MSSFEERQKGFESKFAHDAQMQFKAEARRNKLLGLWAAGRMGMMNPNEAMDYAQEVVKADFEEAGDEDVFRKIEGDLKAKGAEYTDEEIREQMSKFLAEAKAQLMEEIE